MGRYTNILAGLIGLIHRDNKTAYPDLTKKAVERAEKYKAESLRMYKNSKKVQR